MSRRISRRRWVVRVAVVVAVAATLAGCLDLTEQEAPTGLPESPLATPTAEMQAPEETRIPGATMDSPLPTPSPGYEGTPFPIASPGYTETLTAEPVPVTPTPTLPPVELPSDPSRPALVDLSGLASPGAYLGGVRFSPDGAFIFYTLYRSGSGYEYWRMDADLQNRIQMPGLGAILDPQRTSLRIWSPDGTKLIYKTVDESPEIWLTNADGTGQQRLDITGTPNAWSSDSKSIFYTVHDTVNHTVTFWQMDLESGHHKQFVTIPEPDAGGFHWSPDGRQVTIGGGGEGWINLYVANADGSDLRRLLFAVTQQGQSVGGDRWSPDSTMLALTLASWNDESIGKVRKAWVINVATGDLRQLTDTRTASLYWNAEDNRIYYVTGERNTLFVWSINPDGTDQRLEAEFPGVYIREQLEMTMGTYAYWSTDGKRLIIWEQYPQGRFKLVILP